jgi:glutamate-5-semialdehyde dehydrogenase
LFIERLMMSEKSVADIAAQAKKAALELARLPTAVKDETLTKMADELESNLKAILEANAKDLEFAQKENLAGPLISRLTLNEDKVRGMAEGIRSVVSLPDPVAQIESRMELDEDLNLTRVSCPIGVIGAIFESRPDAVPQISSLCLKSGNAVILKGGREAQNSNKIIVSSLRKALESTSGVPVAAVQLIETRSEVAEMLEQDKYINLIVPRGSNDFVRYVQENTRIPVLGHSEGICHVYIDSDAEMQKAIDIALDSKLQYPAACNAMETLLIDKEIAEKILPDLVKQFNEKNVQLLGCAETRCIIPGMNAAGDEEWDTEYNDLKLSIKLVQGYTSAIGHINAHGSGHTDTIITENKDKAERFLNEVDSASVMVNASTRFADGIRYGLGAEIGISTNKTHARGPVGLEGLVIYKYKLIGNGQTVSQYSGKNGKSFTHRRLT